MIKMYGLFLLFSLSSAVCAMQPQARVWMREDAPPSYLSPAAHQRCGKACCALAVLAATEAFIWCSGPSCAMSGHGTCTLWAQARATERIFGGGTVYPAWQSGKMVGIVTHKLDQSLKAMLDNRKEKEE